MKKTQALNPAVRYKLDQVDDRFVPIEAGWKYTVGDYTLEMISVPGHTPGNAMFWAKKQGIMFTGDHILFDISPNITSWLESEDSAGRLSRQPALGQKISGPPCPAGTPEDGRLCSAHRGTAGTP